MAKYFLTFILLACVALDNTNIRKRMFAKSEVHKHPHYHLRHLKYGLPDGSTQNNKHRGYRASHNTEWQQVNDHTSESDEHKVVVEDVNVSEQWDPPNGSYKPNLWHILHTELSKSDGNIDNNNEHAGVDKNIFNAKPNTDEVEMLRDGMYGVDVDNELDVKVVKSSNNYKQHKAQSPPTIKCPKCESNNQNVRVSEEELTRLRIEFVKRQILEKLRLKDKPNVSAVGMPKPIYEATTIQQDEVTNSKDLDDYYARASKKFIFLEREKHECHHLSQPSICFSFKIDDLDAEAIDVSKAVLWIFKKRNRKDLLKQTIIISEVEQGGHNSKYLPKVKPIAIQTADVQEGWMKIDIEWPIKRWFGIHDLSHLIHISCQSCEIDSADGLISTEKDFRPFIMIDTQNRRRVSRQKRSVNCTNGVTECCREKLYISFDEIGWGDWIIRPRGYDAYFCRGSCSTAASIAQSTTHHSSLMRKVISHRDTTSKKPLELIPCCTANQYSSLEIFFRDSNNTATLMKFPNMVIESCGCM